MPFATVDRDAGPLEATAQAIREASGVEVRTFVLDLARANVADAVVGATKDVQIGLLVYNAAIGTVVCSRPTQISWLRNFMPEPQKLLDGQESIYQRLFAWAGNVIPNIGRSFLYCRSPQQKSSAALGVLRRLDGAWALASVFRLLPRPLRDSLYDWVARNRYAWFGKHAECWIPTPELRARFLA